MSDASEARGSERVSEPISIIEELGRDHRLIKDFLAALDHLVRSLRLSAVDPERLRECVEFVERYVEGFHHVREEKILFGYVEDKRIGFGLTVLRLLHGHDDCRNQLEGMRMALPAGTAETRTAFAWNAAAFVKLMRGHVDMEDQTLFPRIASLLSPDDDRELHQRMRARFPDAEKTHAWGEALVRRLRRPPA